MTSRFLNIARCATCATGLIMAQQSWSTPVALQISGQSVDFGGIVGTAVSPLNLRFTVQYDTELPDYDSWNGFGWYQPTYVALSIVNSEGDAWFSEAVNGDSRMLVSVSSYWAKVHQFSASGFTTRAELTPRGDAIIGFNLYLRDESLSSLVDETLPVSIEGLNHMQSASIALTDGSYSAPSGGIFFLNGWTATETNVVVGNVPEPSTLSLILGALAGIGALRRRPGKRASPC